MGGKEKGRRRRGKAEKGRGETRHGAPNLPPPMVLMYCK